MAIFEIWYEAFEVLYEYILELIHSVTQSALFLFMKTLLK